MSVRFAEYSVFLREFRRNFRTTGALLPSGRRLALSLTRYVCPKEGLQRILEVGPGTGAVTRQILARMGQSATLDLVEGNENFVSCLNRLVDRDADFRSARSRVRIFHSSVEHFTAAEPYDVIISGLPLNNFLPEEVEMLLGHLRSMAAVGGVLSFFEYMGVRRVKSLTSMAGERARLRGIGEVMSLWLSSHECGCDWVWPNVPPAWVHHLRF